MAFQWLPRPMWSATAVPSAPSQRLMWGLRSGLYRSGRRWRCSRDSMEDAFWRASVAKKTMEKPRKIEWKPSTSGIWSWNHVDLTWSYHQKCDCTPNKTWNLKDSDPVRWCSALGYGPPEDFHSGSWFQPTYPRGVGGLGELMGRTGGNMWRPSSWLGETAPTLGANLMRMICDLVSGFLGFWDCVLK